MVVMKKEICSGWQATVVTASQGLAERSQEVYNLHQRMLTTVCKVLRLLRLGADPKQTGKSRVSPESVPPIPPHYGFLPPYLDMSLF